MKKGEILSLLDQHREEIMRRFAVKRMALFGSAARDEVRENSDVDLLVAFAGPRKEIRMSVEREAIHVE